MLTSYPAFLLAMVVLPLALMAAVAFLAHRSRPAAGGDDAGRR